MRDEIPPNYVRVTTLLAPYSGLEGINPQVLATAADRGTRVHNYCELYAQSLLIEVDDADCKGYFLSFKNWFDTVVSEVISIEERLFYEEYRVTGKYDLIVKMRGSDDQILVDIKTPASSSKTWAIQTAAYVFMKNQNTKNPLSRRGCLKLEKSGKPATFFEHTENERDEKLFLSLAQIYRYFNN